MSFGRHHNSIAVSFQYHIWLGALLYSRVISVKDLMSRGYHFWVPCYQRAYTWTQDNCEVLFSDMTYLVEQLQNHHEINASHFLGSIVVQKEGSNLQVIDGQQRLVTLYLFYKAFVDIAEQREVNERALAGEVSSKILGKEPPFSLSVDDNHNLVELCKGKEPDSLLTQNYNYFYSVLDETEDLMLTELYKITQHLELVELVIEPENGDDPQLIFESLNAKGEPLTNWDKIRNLALMNIPVNDLERCYQDYWINIDHCAQKGSWVGHPMADDPDSLIFYYLEVKLSKEVDGDHIYNEFKQYCLSYQGTKEEMLNDILGYAKLYEQISSYNYNPEHVNDLTPQLQTEINQTLRNLLFVRNFSWDWFWEWIPFGMQCMKLHGENKLSAKELLDILKLLDSYLVRCWFYFMNKKWFNELFSCLYKAVDSEKSDRSLLDRVKLILNAKEGDMPMGDMPFDDNIVEAVSTYDLYYPRQKLHRPMLMYVLARLEESFEDQDKRFDIYQALIDNTYSIEHVMPQTLNDDWRNELGSDDADNVHSLWLNRIANMTLLPSSDNISLSNESFAVKCSASNGYKNSALKLNRDIAQQNDHWNENALKTRNKVLLNKVLELWPYPVVQSDR